MADSVKLMFALEKDDWKTFTEQLEFFIFERNITDDKNKLSKVMTQVDQDAINLIKKLVAPVQFINKKY